MKRINRSSSYLIRNPYSCCFGLVIPKGLQQYLGKKELRYSLRTGYLGFAKLKARFVAGHVQLITGSDIESYLQKGESNVPNR